MSCKIGRPLARTVEIWAGAKAASLRYVMYISHQAHGAHSHGHDNIQLAADDGGTPHSIGG